MPFISHLKELLQANPRSAQHLGIEVTETVVMQSIERSMSTLNLFRSWGLSVSIDDFGTGYSSLSYLKRLTVDIIKIDRSFVTGLPDDERDCAITEMLLRMTARFGYAALAEGIETAEQLTWLLEHGCQFGQGYLIARPEPFDRLIEGCSSARSPNDRAIRRSARGRALVRLIRRHTIFQTRGAFHIEGHRLWVHRPRWEGGRSSCPCSGTSRASSSAKFIEPIAVR